ncbi:MAG: mycofactocin biosynthesis FMN-dependent deaminase MftD [Acidimicrobiia bacterium]|nr:mycofactocin biosynthesis FMN-dependent deaminase MftD [Acidimicrobiia bacterium]
MGNPWFESVAVAQKRAKRILPPSVYGALIAGSEQGTTMNDNTAAFSQIMLSPITVGQPAHREMATEVMGQPMAMPVMISPTGVQAVHPEGEVAVARAAAARGVVMGLSSFASKPIEEVIEHNPQLMFQVYWAGDQDSIVERLDRAKRAGAVGLILTADWSFSHSRDWGSPNIPQSIDMKTLARHLPESIIKPRWLARWARAGWKPPTLAVPNFATAGSPAPTFFEAYGTWMQTAPPTWHDVAWLCREWDGPVMVKGVLRVDEARRAVDAGAAAVSVSNHGGNNLDGSPAPIRVLSLIADAVGDQVDVVMDGGVRRGSDVVKALALGARAVMIGRACLWGLAVDGQAGVENVLDVLRMGIESTMTGMGVTAISELSPDHLHLPADFTPAGWQ